MNKRIEEKLVLKKSVKKFINNFLLTIIILLIGLITVKQYPNLKQPLQVNLYEESLKFQTMKSFYEKYFGNILLTKKKETTEAVFSEKLAYLNKESIKNGVKLKVEDHYQVPAIDSGVVVYIGEKENYGNVIIIDQIDGVETMYASIKGDSISLYDYVEKGDIIGKTSNNNLYLIFQKDGKYLDYKDFI